MKIFISFVFLISAQALASGGFVVGNGGEGVQVQDKIYLRDLFDMGAHRHEISLGEVAPIYRENIHDLQLGPQFPYQHLAAKLTQLDQLSPGFGRMLFVAIKKHTWVYVPVSLPKAPDFTNNCQTLPRSYPLRIQLALRQNDLIRMDQNAFQRMSSTNQVALVLHEVIFSLVIPQTVYNQLCFHGATQTRDIVGLLFHSGFLELGQQGFEKRVFPNLNIPLLRELPSNLDDFTYEYDLPLSGLSYWGGRVQKFVHPSLRQEHARRICLTAKERWQVSDREIKIRLTTNPFVQGNFSTVISNFGPQYYLALIYAPQVTQEVSLREGMESCVARVKEFFRF